MVRITDKEFKYTPSFATDLRKKFRQIELERKRAEKRVEEKSTTLPDAVVTLIRKGSVK